MLYRLTTVFFILWALSLLTSFTMGGFIHLLLVAALVLALVRVVHDRGLIV